MGGIKADIVFTDPFLGSGSTLIAAEKTERICFGLELDPKFVDTIIQRYCDYVESYEINRNGETITWQKQEDQV